MSMLVFPNSPALTPRNVLPPRFGTVRAASRYEAFDSGIDPGELQAARKWRQDFSPSSLPKGKTVYSRSSGPGGQHVNKTETKAMTSWPVGELLRTLPRLMHAKVRLSRYYVQNTDSLTMQAQTHRNRSANAEENETKLRDELLQIYSQAVPGETSPDNASKYKTIEKSFHEKRIKSKKAQSSKKQSRRGGGDGD